MQRKFCLIFSLSSAAERQAAARRRRSILLCALLCFLVSCFCLPSPVFSLELSWGLDEIFGDKGRGQNELKAPVDVALLGSGDEIAVLDFKREAVVVFSSRGDWLRTLCDSGKCSGAKLDKPKAIASDDDEKLWIVDSGNHRIVVIDSNGSVVKLLGESGTRDGRFRHPSDVALHKGKVYVADTGNERIQVFKQDGTFVSSWEKRTGGRKGHLDQPVALAASKRGKDGIWVANKGSKKLELFNLDGEWEETFDIPLADVHSVYPGGLEIESRFQRMFISAQAGAPGNSKVFVLDHRGRLIAEVDRPNKENGVLGGLAVGRQLSMFVADVDNASVLKFELE